MAKRLLILHYSLTGQADLAALLAKREADRAGWNVTARRIVFAPGERRPERPFRIADAAFWTKAAQNGTTFKVTLDAPIDGTGRFDGALLFSNTWGDSPAVPIRSFLLGAQARMLLQDVPTGLFVVCRRLWRKNGAASARLIQQAGGTVVDTVPLVHSGGQVGSLVQTVTHMFRSGDTGLSSLLGIPLPPFGLSLDSRDRVRPATRRMLETMSAR